MKYVLPKLPYAYDALEPFIDAKTMEIHLTKHHQTYIDRLNAVLEKYPSIADKQLESILRNIASLGIDEKDRETLKNNGGGHLNHSMYWEIMNPLTVRDFKLVKRIESAFTSVAAFKTLFTDVAMARFGSGWAWLVEKPDKKLAVYSTPNQDSPLISGDTPIFGLDVWEHAYYLKYQNRRADYIKNWWNVIKLL